MYCSWKWTFLNLLTLLLTGLTYGEVTDLSCGTFCLDTQTACTCEVEMVNASFLRWNVSNISGADVGVLVLNSSALNIPQTLNGLPSFDVLLTGSSLMMLTSTLNFNTTSKYQNYTISCGTDDDNVDESIYIPGIPSAIANLTVSEANATSVLFTFEAPTDSPCVDYYSVVTNADAPTTTINTSILVRKPAMDAPDTRYMVNISAVDFAGREGYPTSSGCFMFTNISLPCPPISDNEVPTNETTTSMGTTNSGSMAILTAGPGRYFAVAVVGIITVFAVSGI